MKIPTHPGHSYAITAPSPCTVSSVAGDGSLTPLLAVSTPGQYVLVAPSCALHIDESHALVTPMQGRPGVAGSAQAATPATVLEHMADGYIHVNRAERNKWDNMVDSQRFTEHAYNLTLHLMADEHASLTQLIQHKEALLALLNPAREQTA